MQQDVDQFIGIIATLAVFVGVPIMMLYNRIWRNTPTDNDKEVERIVESICQK